MPGVHDQAGEPADDTTPAGIDLGLGIADALDAPAVDDGVAGGVGLDVGASVAELADPVGAALGDVVGDDHGPGDGLADGLPGGSVLAVDDLGLDVSGTFADVDGTDLSDVAELTRSLHDPAHDPTVAHGLLDGVVDDVVDLFDGLDGG